MMPEEQYLATPQPGPPFQLPDSAKTVKVSCIDSTSRIKLPMKDFLQPDYVGMKYMDAPSFAFLIEHPERKPILFDLGIRKDWQELRAAPKFKELKWTIIVEKNVSEILRERGFDIDGGAIESLVFSHHHWDHVGTATTFPTSTQIVVGQGFTKEFLPGYPKNPDSPMLEADFAGRSLRELDFETSGLQIGRFRAVDYFGDGSFYLLDTPGHTVAHMCGLARTTAHSSDGTQPSTFVFLGGDAAHHNGEYRPSQYLPIPRELDAAVLPAFRSSSGACPGHLLEEINAHGSADKTFYHPSEVFTHDLKLTHWTLDGMKEFDAREEVLLVIAHDDTLVRDEPQLPFYPLPLNDWYARGVKPKVTWLFLRDYQDAVTEKQKGGQAFSWNSDKDHEAAKLYGRHDYPPLRL